MILIRRRCPYYSARVVVFDGVMVCCQTLFLNDFVIQLTPREVSFVGSLLPLGFIKSFDEIIETMYPDPDIEPDTAVDVIRVTAYYVRKKIFGTGLRIDTVWGRGYSLHREVA